MTVVVELAPEIEFRLNQEAWKAGVAVPRLVAQIVEERFSAGSPAARNGADEGEDWESMLHSQTVSVVAISPDMLRRESLSRDED